MPVADRAKQFAPFSALRGLDAALEEKRRALERSGRRTLSEESAEALDRRLRGLTPGVRITAVYYRNGDYPAAAGAVRRVDGVRRVLRIDDTEIAFDDLFEITDDQGE